MNNSVKCVCRICGAPFSIRQSEYNRGRGKFCSNSCKGKYQHAVTPPDQKGPKNSQWHGGRYKDNNYVKIYAPNHPFNRKGYVVEHRLVMERKIGRYLTESEIVHHINFKKNDNNEENLLLVTKSEHNQLHWMLKKLEFNVNELPFEALQIITYNCINQIRDNKAVS